MPVDFIGKHSNEKELGESVNRDTGQIVEVSHNVGLGELFSLCAGTMQRFTSSFQTFSGKPWAESVCFISILFKVISGTACEIRRLWTLHIDCYKASRELCLNGEIFVLVYGVLFTFLWPFCAYGYFKD